ncbi:MAG: hypothetical protein ACKOEQ_05245 [Verrucomicrobiota bacterium]
MIIEVHLGPSTQRDFAQTDRQVLLIRCRAKPRAAWISTSFNKAVTHLDDAKVHHHLKKLHKGALPGLAAWFLRKRAGSVEPFPRQLSDQIRELVVQGKAKREETWLGKMLGGDPLPFFQSKDGAWLAGEALCKAPRDAWPRKRINPDT